ncbi:MAG: 5-formyltetrahydrofolate cyclo-ligase [Candidatus Omnitrophica bacterium]|nr:5-formyltetrahydrofolate cyclo-ligase [Candidatus Omnitrophota bacterium]
MKKQSRKARLQKSRTIEKKLFQRREFRRSHTVMFYVSLPEEVDTYRMIRLALRLGKRVVVPSLEGRRIRPAEVLDFKKDLSPQRFGILEPRSGRRRLVSSREIDLVVVPGIAFDAKGNRLGRGGGYYDRFLKRFKGRIPLIGLAFRFQRVIKLPTSLRDVPVSAVITA